jgi:hypothetical protein
MKPRPISETQKVRALSLGIHPALIQDNVQRAITNLGCLVETYFTEDNQEHVTLTGPKTL